MKNFSIAPDIMNIAKMQECEQADQVIMEHQLCYEFRDEQYEFKATLISKGDNVREGALAKAIGLTCGIAAKSLLLGSIIL